jgi:peptidyl-prolyl cis-trans isomerase D
LEFFREQLETEVRNQKKKEIILAKLKGFGNVSLDEMAKKYGPGASVSEAKDVTMQSASMGTAGYTPIGVGRAFGLKKGARTNSPFADENGVLMVEVTEQIPAAQIADYTQYKNTLLTTQKQNATNFSYQALMELYRVQDLTYRLD